MSQPLFEIVTTTTGAVSIRNNLVNEIMHNPVGPWIEANALYIDQSRLKEKLLTLTADPLVVFDVGLGAAANALAALHCARNLKLKVSKGSTPQSIRKLKLVSFEKDLGLLEFALANANKFEHFKGFESALRQILESKTWECDGVEWQLHHGDFLDCIEAEHNQADVVFFDPYSPLVNTEMWTTKAFKKIKTHCHDDESRGATLLTYSQATPVRVALLTAGFFIGAGQATGLKHETTQAATRHGDLDAPLGERWLMRWKNSHTPYPPGCSDEQKAAVKEAVLNHPQFRGSGSI